MLPFKMRVYQFVAESNRAVNADDIMSGLQGEYGGEKQFNRKRVEHYLDAIAAVGMIEESQLGFNDKGELTIDYSSTKLGRDRLKYLPRKN